MNKSISIKAILLDGNHLALNFINTIYNRLIKDSLDYLQDSNSWIAWLERVELIEPALDRTVTDANFDIILRQLRELLYRLFMAVINNNTPTQKDLQQFNKALVQLQKIGKSLLKKE